MFDEIKAGIKSSLGQTQVRFSSICPQEKKTYVLSSSHGSRNFMVDYRKKAGSLRDGQVKIRRKPNAFEHLDLGLEIIASNQILFSNNDTRREHYTARFTT